MFSLSKEQWDKMIEILESSSDCMFKTSCWDGGWCGGIRSYNYLSPDLLEKLVEEGYADPEERQNDSPSIEEWLTFIEENPTLENKISFHGYVVHKDRGDRRISVEGIQASPQLEGPISGMDLKLTEKEIETLEKFCHYADDVRIGEDHIYVWYD